MVNKGNQPRKKKDEKTSWRKRAAYLSVPLAVLVFTIVDISVRKFCTTFSVTLVGVRVGVSDIGLNKDERRRMMRLVG